MSDYLPQEVLIKILTRLPPKSLIKFKCVSKSWNSLISSPYFIFLQTHHATTSKPTNLPSNQVLIRHYSETQDREICSVYNDDNEEFSVDKNIRIIEYPFSNNVRDYYRIVGSYNGVLCLSEDLIRHTNTSIVLWNPVIRRRVALPKPQHTYNSCVLGFGFDVVSNDYKVVRLAYAKGDDGCVMFPPKVEVYSLRVRSWREIINVEIPHHCNLEYFCAQVFINRNVHWMAFRREEKEIKNFILVFDIGLEVFNEMPLPELLVYELPGNLNAMVIRESLAICQADFHVRSIWIMNKYGDVGSWSKMFNVRLSGVLTICGFRMNGDILLAVMRRGLVSYNLETGASVDLGYLGVQDLFYVGSYVESLALLNEGEEVCERDHSNTKNESLSESDYSDEDE